MAGRDHLAEQAALPLAQIYLAQGRLHPQAETEPLGQRLGGLRGPAQGRHVDGIDAHGRQPGADPVSLLPAQRRQGRIAVPAHQRERRAVSVGFRFAVPDQQEIHRLGRQFESVLPEGSSPRGLCFGHKPPSYRPPRPARPADPVRQPARREADGAVASVTP